jgi:hypothetical protein
VLRILILAALTLPAYAQTYKWVDAKGVVNYSNTPPPGGQNAVTVPDRISNYTPDPSITQTVNVGRQDTAEAEWLQRQYLMAMQQATPPAPAADPRYAGTYYPAAVFFATRRPLVRHTFFAPLHPRPVRRASLNRF